MTRAPAPGRGPAGEARALLAPALSALERNAPGPAFATRALEHTAHAMSALYGAEAEASTDAAATSGLRKALDELSHALEALHDAPSGSPDTGAATEAVARTLAFLYPVVTAAQRQRREVLPPGAVPSVDREALKAMAGGLAAPGGRVAPEHEQRRTAERASVEVDIGVLSDSNFYTGMSQDISHGGVFVATPTPLSVGATLTLYFTLPDARSVRVDGTVRWTRSGQGGLAPGMGVGFSRLAEDDERAIADFCARRAPLFHE